MASLPLFEYCGCLWHACFASAHAHTSFLPHLHCLPLQFGASSIQDLKFTNVTCRVLPGIECYGTHSMHVLCLCCVVCVMTAANAQKNKALDYTLCDGCFLGPFCVGPWPVDECTREGNGTARQFIREAVPCIKYTGHYFLTTLLFSIFLGFVGCLIRRARGPMASHAYLFLSLLVVSFILAMLSFTTFLTLVVCVEFAVLIGCALVTSVLVLGNCLPLVRPSCVFVYACA